MEGNLEGLSKMLLSDDDITQGVSRKLPVCLCLDSSYSMKQNNKIDMLNTSVKKFIKSAADDPISAGILDLCIISYGGEKPEVICDFTNVQKVRYKDIIPSGGTPMGAAVELGINKVIAEKEKWKNRGITVNTPWIIILSDGEADDNIEKSVKMLNDLLTRKKIKAKCLGIGNTTFTSLKRYTPKEKIIECKDFEISNFFDYLSQSVAQASVEIPGSESDFI